MGSWAQDPTIGTIAGSGAVAYAGDQGQAMLASFYNPNRAVADAAGNLFIADYYNHTVRRVDAITHVITSYAGSGAAGFSGDGFPASTGTFYYVASVAVNAGGDLFIADQANFRIRKVAAGTGILSTISGTGVSADGGDGGAATAATFITPYGLTVDSAGNVYVVDYTAHRVRKITIATGIITTVAGNGSGGYGGDGGLATAATLLNPAGVAVDASGNIYIADSGNNRIRKVTVGTGIISTVAGTGTGSYSGDGGLATAGTICTPWDVALDSAGNLFIADYTNQRIRRVDHTTGFISSLAGTGSPTYSGDGGDAALAALYDPTGVMCNAAGSVIVADRGNQRIRTLSVGPVVVTTASASPIPVIGTTTTLNVLGGSVAGEATLSYSWSTFGSPPAAVLFSPNGNNAAKSTTATFSQVGTYWLQCTITDGAAKTTTSVVQVTVVATPSTLVVAPATLTVALNGTGTYTATLKDQFGIALASQPTFTWTTSGGGTISSAGVFTAGAIAGGPYTITASGGGKTGTATVTVAATPPTVATAASASPNPTTGTTTALSVLGADAGGAATLTYTWSTTGSPPAAVTFNPNGTNAARAATATFTKSGSYSLLCTITNTAHLSVTSPLVVTVTPTLATIVVAPSSSSVFVNGTTTFAASGKDQFGIVMTTQPTFSWTTSGGGTISSAGVFTAGATAGGPYTITASSGGKTGTATATVTTAPPTVATAASASPNPTTGTTTMLGVMGADDLGAAALTYTWFTTGSPPAAVTFSPNATNAAHASTATFTKSGSYSLLCTITDTASLSVTSSVTVTVTPILTSIAVSPATARVNPNGTQTCTASGLDQFGLALATQPTFTWIVSGGGTIAATGVFTAGTTAGGPYTVTAASGGKTGTSTVTVNAAPTVATAASASPNPTTGTTIALSVLGADDAGAAALTYTWSTSGTPPAAVAFSPNGTTAAHAATASFTKSGGYTLLCTITDGGGLSVSSSVAVTVTPTLASIIVTPGSSTIALDGTATYAASARDQFGIALATQPTFTWATSGGGTISSAGVFTASATAGGPYTITASSGSKSGTATATVVATPPTVATAASASPNPAIGTTTTLSVLGADDLGAAALTYTWSTTGIPPAAVTFSPNGTNAAHASLATFTKPGSYSLLCTITDTVGLSVTSPVTVTVTPTLTTITVTPAAARVNPGATQAYAASGLDQFGLILATQPTFAWSVSGGGAISTTGIFTAGTTAGGPYTVTAASGGKSGTAPVTVNAAPTVATAASASPNPTTGTTTALSVLGADDAGAAALTYTWSTSGTPPAAVAFSPNGTNAAHAATATFTRSGGYTLLCTITDGGGLTVTSSVAVTVTQLLTSIAVSPATARVNPTSTQAFSASALDQFGIALATQPTITWSASGGGTIAATGVFTAGTTTGGPYTVTAANGGKSGTASVTVNAAPTVATAASASPNPTTGTTTAVNIQGVDDGGAAALIYTWSTSGTPPAAVAFSPNGINAAHAATASFIKSGGYTLLCTITDGGGLSVTSSVAVTVTPTLTSITVAPASSSIALDGTASYAASALDQFGIALATQPTFTWTTTGGGTISSAGVFTASATSGGPYVITASGSGMTGTATATVVAKPPTVTTAASASPNPTSGTTTTLNVLGADDLGAAALTYTWSTTVTPPAAVTFSPNGTNAAHAATATFTKSGIYSLQCTITDTVGQSVTSPVTVTVTSTPTSIAVSPVTARVNPSNTQAFAASALDQFGLALATQPTFTWSVSGGGAIATTGIFTAGTTAGGPYTVTAAGSGKTGTAPVTVNAAPTVSTAAKATPSPTTLTTTALSVLGADDGGAAALTYTWSTSGTPPAAVTFTPNGTNAAHAATATFTKPGSYTLLCTIADGGGLTLASSVAVTVTPALTSIAVSPATAQVKTSGTQAFTASGLDQFGVALATQPSFSWTVPSAGGTISAGGLFTAAGAIGGPYAVTATSGTVTGTGQVSVITPLPTVVVPASASIDPSGMAASLGVRGTDAGGAASLIYTWSVVGTPPGAVVFVPNGTNAAQNSTAKFTVPGTYTLQVTLKNAQNLTAVSQVTLTIGSTVSPLVGLIAGTGTAGAQGDSGPALMAQLNTPNGLVVDSGGTIYVADWYNNRIRCISAGTFIMSTLAGTGGSSSSGDGGPASAATINQPLGVALDGLGNLYIAEYGGNCIRKVVLATGIITTIAGTGVATYTGDGGPAVTATLNAPGSVACDAAGNVYVTDLTDGVLRRITISSGKIATIAGPGSSSTPGDGGPASAAYFNGLNGIAIDRSGNIFVEEFYSSRIRRIDAASNIITTIASNASTPPTEGPNGISCDGLGNVFVSNFVAGDIVRIDSATGSVTTFAGSGSGSYGGDGGLAINAGISNPSGSGFDAQGAFYFCDRYTHRIRIVTTGPVIATQVAAGQNPVTTASTILTVLGAASEGEPALSYSWSLVGSPPAPVQFSINGTNAAKSTTATFSAAGTYLFEASVGDAKGRIAVSQLQVAVVSTPVSGISLAPTTATTSINGYQQYTCTVSPDQFGLPNAVPISWATSGTSFISTNGLFTADATPGTFAITAVLGSMSATASVTVVNVAPTFAIAANANPNPVTGIGTRLAAFGSSVGGESLLTYSWSVVGTPPAPVILGVSKNQTNGTNAAKITSAQFAAIGTYTFQVTETDGVGQTASSQVTVTVVPTFSSMTLSPNPMYVDPGASQTSHAKGLDQFGNAVTIPSSITWTLTDALGLGSLSQEGVLTATTKTGGPSTVTATCAGISASASLYVGHLNPIAQNQALYTAVNVPVVVTLVGSSPDLDHITFSTATTPGHGTLSGTPPVVTYTPQSGFLGTDSFTFTVFDGQTTSSAGTVTIEVLGQIATQASTRSPLIVPVPFDPARWGSDTAYQTSYLTSAEPGRVWQGAGGAPGITTLVAAAATTGGPAGRIVTAPPASLLTLAVQGAPNAPVTFLCLGPAVLSIAGLEGTASTNCLTIAADATGKASVSVQLPVSGRIPIIAASPLAVGQVRFVVKIQDPPLPPPPPPYVGVYPNPPVTIVYTVTSSLPEVLPGGFVYSPVFTDIVVTPNPASVPQGGYRQFTAIAVDQLGQPLRSQPQFSWTLTDTLGLGNLTSQGVFFANYVVGGPSTITASSSGFSVSIPVSVTVP